MPARRVQGEAPPAAANIENALAGLKAELGAYELELGFLDKVLEPSQVIDFAKTLKSRRRTRERRVEPVSESFIESIREKARKQYRNQPAPRERDGRAATPTEAREREIRESCLRRRGLLRRLGSKEPPTRRAGRPTPR